MGKNNVIRCLVFVLALAALLAFPLEGFPQAPSTMKIQVGQQAPDFTLKIQVGQQAPDFTLKSLDGREITLSDYLGKNVVILVFWAGWYGVSGGTLEQVCKAADYYNKKLKDKGIEVLGITVRTEVDEAVEFVRKNNILFPILLDDRLYVATEVYGLTGPIPVEVIIGMDGKVKFTFVGQWPDMEAVNEMERVLQDLIKELPGERF